MCSVKQWELLAGSPVSCCDPASSKPLTRLRIHVFEDLAGRAVLGFSGPRTHADIWAFFTAASSSRQPCGALHPAWQNFPPFPDVLGLLHWPCPKEHQHNAVRVLSSLVGTLWVSVTHFLMACRRSFVLAVVEVWRWVLVVVGAAGEGKEPDFGFHQKQKIFQFNSPWTSCHHLLQIPLPPSSPKHPYFTRFHSAYCVYFPSVDSLGSSTELFFHPWCSQLCGGTHELCRAGLGNRSWNKTGIHLLAFYVAVRFSDCSPWCWDPNDNSAPQQDPEAHRDIAPACIWRVFGSRCQPSQITFCSAIRTCASRVTGSLVCTRICGGVQLILAIMPATVRCGSESKLQVGQSPLWWCSCLFPDPNELCLAWIFVIRWIELLHLNRAGMCKTVKLE